MAGAAFALLIIMLPQLVVAETTEEVTTIVNIGPYNSNADEVVNIANETSRWNVDTWSYLPAGIFVGGTIPESSLRLHEMFTAEGYLLLATPIQFQDTYSASGASMFTVRLPWAVTPEYVDASHSYGVELWILRLADPTDWSINWTWNGAYYRPEPLIDDGRFIAHVTDVGGFAGDGTPNTNPVNDTWVTDNRLYARIYAPLVSEQYHYLFLTAVPLKGGSFADIYLHPSDLASDDQLSSKIQLWWAEGDGAHNRVFPVAADLGYSFVLQKSIGELALSYDQYYSTGHELVLTRWVQSPTKWLNGSFNLVFEFGADADDPLEVDIRVEHNPPLLGLGSGDVCLDEDYWSDVSFSQYVVASNPQNTSYEGVEYPDGTFWHEFEVTLTFTNATRMQFLCFADPQAPLDGRTQIAHIISPTSWQRIYFSPWLTCSVDPFTFNKTYVAPIAGQGSSFELPDRDFFLAHWFDKLGAVLWDTGEKLVRSGIPGGEAIGTVLMAAGVVAWAQAEWLERGYDTAVDVIRTIIDIIIDIGEWLWNAAMWVWKALTWLAEKIVYYGSIILGLLIILIAIFIFVVPVYFEIKILGAFLAMAQGDYEKASAQLAGVVSAGKTMMGRG